MFKTLLHKDEREEKSSIVNVIVNDCMIRLGALSISTLAKNHPSCNMLFVDKLAYSNKRSKAEIALFKAWFSQAT